MAKSPSFGKALAKAFAEPDETMKAIQRLMLRRLLVPGLRLARNPTNTPKDTGELIRGNQVIEPTRTKSTVTGGLRGSVEYARFQEHRNPTKPFFLLNAIRSASFALELDLRDKQLFDRLTVKRIT